MGGKTLIGGTGYDISGGKTLVNSTDYSVSGGKTLIGGTGYSISFGTPVEDLVAGDSVYLNVAGVRTEFLIVNKGRPEGTYYSDGTGGQIYDDSCDGVWLLMKDVYENRAWATYSTYNDYGKSTINTYLNGEFLAKFDSKIQNLIKQVKVPFFNGISQPNPTGGWAYGENGLSTKVFLLGIREVGVRALDYSNARDSIGVTLQYFLEGTGTDALERRKAYFNGAYNSWWTRVPYGPSAGDDHDRTLVLAVSNTGSSVSYTITQSVGVRPAIIIPNDAKMDAEHNILA